ncbi:Red chlorophyll catabolite reductase [Morus notabilis]|uniref:red chlorophyll catabolite reductase n=1 Tax=Morus notabilis TaxID=981085 RepID=W9R4L2_9ROSA|nr:red chlorophyll catabolite reductase, chloroplastic [Morus notabilis]XP_010102572.1 red chlorophyll catabolite reductase, chloroplastic [Morus notabilis]EXB54409.1 Red chlorophyll catabolite reductase [Morus notabilis]EXC45891.1 Red chlorophyll catabolite reductase [Morus notabilis]
MAVINSCHCFHSLSSSPPPSSISGSLHSSPTPRPRISASTAPSHMDLHNQGRSKFMEFPYVSAPHKKLMVDLVSTVENRLDSQLFPCTLPHDVQSYHNQNGTSHASLHIRSGHKSSPIDFVLGSWIHCELPTGGALNITSLSTYLNSSTDAPNFLIEIIRNSPTSLIVILDLPPRKDLVLIPDYLKTFYEDTKLEAQRQLLEKVPEVKPYFSSSLYIRSVVSPTAIMVRIEAEAVERLEEIIEDYVDPISKEVLRIWLEQCACVKREVNDEAEKNYLQKRDKFVKTKTIEIDLASSLPRLFGPETADRVMAAVKKYFSS